MRWASFMLCSGLAATPLAAQEERQRTLTYKDALLAAGAAAVWLVPIAATWGDPQPSCAPCDPATVPFFDRWAIREPEVVAMWASDMARAGVAVASWLDLAGEGRVGAQAIVASLESMAWANAVTLLAKDAFGRHRPVMYTDIAHEVADSRSNLRSMPSGHTSTAFALATSYWLSRTRITDEDKPWLRWVLMAGATTVGVLRVAAGKHYPSDVLVGAAVGVTSAVVIHQIRF
jgi:membrane-associated phospholipid phosphatase